MKFELNYENLLSSKCTWNVVYNMMTFLFGSSCFNSLAPGKFEWNFRHLIFQITSVTDGWDISCELAPRWMSLDLTDDKSALVQVMAWCCQATSHYLSQCWPRSMSPYDVTTPQWVKSFTPGRCCMQIMSFICYQQLTDWNQVYDSSISFILLSTSLKYF